MRSVSATPDRINAQAVWRDALGPGFAVAVGEGLLRIAGAAAVRPYRVRR